MANITGRGRSRAAGHDSFDSVRKFREGQRFTAAAQAGARHGFTQHSSQQILQPLQIEVAAAHDANDVRVPGQSRTAGKQPGQCGGSGGLGV